MRSDPMTNKRAAPMSDTDVQIDFDGPAVCESALAERFARAAKATINRMN
jgi:hypothetical protein